VQWAADGVAISDTVNDQRYSIITSDGSGGAIVAWVDNRSGSGNLYAQRVDSTGAMKWISNGIAVSSQADLQIDDPFNTAIISDSFGGAIIAWWDNRSGNRDIYAQRIDSSGSEKWMAGGLAVCSAANQQGWPAMISNGFGEVIITWDDDRDGEGAIYAQRIDLAGAVKWAVDGVAISVAPGRQQVPSIVSNGSGGAIISFMDRRNNQWDIYAQNVLNDGSISGMEDPKHRGSSITIFPNPNYGEFTIASSRKGTFSLYNSLGQEIRTFQFHSSNTVATVSQLDNGVYFLLGADRKTAVEKIVVCR
jgi:hypothetical protein